MLNVFYVINAETHDYKGSFRSFEDAFIFIQSQDPEHLFYIIEGARKWSVRRPLEPKWEAEQEY